MRLERVYSMLDVYQKNGYVDFDKVIKFAKSKKVSFIWLVGGRAIGKTFNSLEYCKRNNLKFMFIRRLKTQYDILKGDAAQPFKKINNVMGYHVTTASITPGLSGFFNQEYNDEKKMWEIIGEPIGYFTALSTFANINGIDFSDVDIILWDEFIPKPNEAKIRDEFGAFLGLYESVNRNRELEGREPVLCVGMANANNLSNPIFAGLNIVNKVLSSRNKGNDYFVDYKRSFMVIDFVNSPITEKKIDTVLYKLSKDTSYYDMAIDNDFVEVDTNNVVPHNLLEFRPLVAVGELFIYEHKSQDLYYITHIGTGVFNEKYTSSDYDLKAFNIKYGWSIRNMYLSLNNIDFESYNDKVILHSYINI